MFYKNTWSSGDTVLITVHQSGTGLQDNYAFYWCTINILYINDNFKNTYPINNVNRHSIPVKSGTHCSSSLEYTSVSTDGTWMKLLK